MTLNAQIEKILEGTLSTIEDSGGPPLLSAALRHAVFPGGARVRPQLCAAVAQACDPNADLSDAIVTGAALELMHCASLIHDDLPCFDNAEVRRGKPSVHSEFGENIAVLAGDALIVMSFQLIAANAKSNLSSLIAILAEASAPPHGICAGQAWESEPVIDLEAYHEAKTAALFIAAARAGAASVGYADKPWRQLGLKLGAAYQLADDIRDVVMTPEELGKPANQDEKHARPSATAEFGLGGAYDRMLDAIEAAATSVPQCAGIEQLQQLIYAQAKRLVPAHIVQLVA